MVGAGGCTCSSTQEFGATVDQVHNHLELRTAFSVEWAGETLSPGRVLGHYCNNGDRVLPFQIEKII